MKEKLLRLIQHLENNPRIVKVFLNEVGDWLFHAHDKFPNVKTRDEILGLKDQLSDDDAQPLELTKLESISEPVKTLSTTSEEYLVEKLTAENKQLTADNAALTAKVADLQNQLATALSAAKKTKPAVNEVTPAAGN